MWAWAWGALAWGASAQVWGACPDALTVEVGGLAPGEVVVLRVGHEVAPRAREGGVCHGMVLDVPADHELRAVAGSSGYAVWSAPAGEVLCDAVVQVVRPAVCEALPAVDLRSPACADGAVATSDADLAPLATCRVTGPLVVTNGVTRVELPELVVVEDLIVGPSDTLPSLALPALKRVRGALVLTGTAASVDLGRLRRAGSVSLWQVENGSIDLRRLARVADALDVSGAGAFVAPALVHAGQLRVGGATVSLSLPALEDLDGLVVSGASWLESVSLPLVRRVGGESRVEGAGVLHHVDLTSLREVDDLAILHNPSLCPADGDDGWPRWGDVTWYAALRVGDNAPGCFGVALP